MQLPAKHTLSGGARTGSVSVPGRAPYWAAQQHTVAMGCPTRWRHEPYCRPRGLPKAVGNFGRRFVGPAAVVTPEAFGRNGVHALDATDPGLADTIVAGPGRQFEAICTTFGIPRHAVAKLMIGQVPYHVTTAQLANAIARSASAKILALEPQTADATRGGPQRRTGLWFAYVAVDSVAAFLRCDRRILLRYRDYIIVKPRNVPLLRHWCEAKRAAVQREQQQDQQHGCAPLPLLPVCVELHNGHRAKVY